jgi:hypothetical protein
MNTTPFDPPVPPPPTPPVYPIAWIGVVAAVCALIGSFLPWASIVTVLGSVDVAGTHGDGKITLGLALIGGAALFAAMYGRGGSATIAGVLGAVGFAVSFYDFSNLNDKLGAVDSRYATADVGAGLFMCLIGFGVLTACAFTTRATIQPAPKASFDPPLSPDGSY